MIVYNKTLLENTFLVAEAIDLNKSSFIQETSLNSIKQELQTLKTSRNVFVRLGFFILGVLLLSSIIGFITLISIDSYLLNHNNIIGFVFSLISLVLLEIICNLNYFRHGLDDAFLIGAQLSFYITLFTLTDSYIILTISMIIIGLFFCIRYVSTLSFLVFLSGIVLLLSILLIDYTTISSALPFVLLLIAVGFYSIHQKVKDIEQFYFYQNVLDWFFIFSLFLGYASINYFVVRALSEELLDADYSETEMPFGWFFSVLMFLLPIVYVIYALRTKNRVMLYIGGLTFVLSIATFRYYHSVMPAEWALILAGALIFGAAYFIIQRIKDKATGITFQPDHTTNTAMLNTVEALIVNSQDMHHAEGQATQQSDMPFGGGGFSGGGGGESF
jgi:hypothetical protein